MINNALVHLLGLDYETSELIATIIKKRNLTGQVEDRLYSLPPEILTSLVHTDGVIDDPIDPDNYNIKGQYKKHNTGGWDPDEADRLADVAQKSTPNVSEPDQYAEPTMKENSQLSFIQYLMREAINPQIDSDMIDMGDQIDDTIDATTKMRINAYLKQGNKTAADKLRTMSMRRNNLKNVQPKTPTEVMVDAKKKQLSQALRANSINQQRIAKQQPGNISNDQNGNQ